MHVTVVKVSEPTDGHVRALVLHSDKLCVEERTAANTWTALNELSRSVLGGTAEHIEIEGGWVIAVNGHFRRLPELKDNQTLALLGPDLNVGLNFVRGNVLVMRQDVDEDPVSIPSDFHLQMQNIFMVEL